MIDDEWEKLQLGSEAIRVELRGGPFVRLQQRDPLLQTYDKIDVPPRRPDSSTVAHAKRIVGSIYGRCGAIPEVVWTSGGGGVLVDYRLPMFLVSIIVDEGHVDIEVTHDEAPLDDVSVVNIVAALLAAKEVE